MYTKLYKSFLYIHCIILQPSGNCKSYVILCHWKWFLYEYKVKFTMGLSFDYISICLKLELYGMKNICKDFTYLSNYLKKINTRIIFFFLYLWICGGRIQDHEHQHWNKKNILNILKHKDSFGLKGEIFIHLFNTGWSALQMRLKTPGNKTKHLNLF